MMDSWYESAGRWFERFGEQFYLDVWVKMFCLGLLYLFLVIVIFFIGVPLRLLSLTFFTFLVSTVYGFLIAYLAQSKPRELRNSLEVVFVWSLLFVLRYVLFWVGEALVGDADTALYLQTNVLASLIMMATTFPHVSKKMQED